MKKIITLLVTVFYLAHVNAQVPAIQWQKSFGGSNLDFAYAIQPTTDGGYIVAGATISNDGDVTGNHGIYDYWILKLSSTGNIEWQRSFGGSNSDVPFAIQQTTDGGYIVAGNSSSNDGDVNGNHGADDYWVVKLNSIGNIEWQKSLGGTNADNGVSMQQTTDGGYIVAGFSYSNDGEVTGNHGGDDYWVVKLNSTGNIEWQKSLGGTGEDFAYAIQQTTDGGYIVAGYSSSNNGNVTGNHGYNDYWVVKLSSTGNIEWQKSLGGSNYDYAYAIRQTTDGGYIVAGTSYSNDGNVTGNHGAGDYWVVKLSSTGNIEWQKSLGGTGDDSATSIQQTTDGGYIVAGNSSSNDGDVTGNHGFLDYWVVKLNSTGNIEWQKSLGGSNFDYAYAIQQTTDGGYIVAGNSPSNNGDVTGNHGNDDYWVVKLVGSILPLQLLHFDATKNNGNIQLNWQTTNEINTSHFIVQRCANGTIFNNTGRVEARNTSGTNNYSLADASPINGINFYRLQMVDIDGKITYSPIIKIVFAGKNELQVFPNPARDVITLSGLQNKGIIKIISTEGKLLKQLNANANSMTINITTLAKGMYLVQYNYGEKAEQLKIIKE